MTWARRYDYGMSCKRRLKVGIRVQLEVRGYMVIIKVIFLICPSNPVCKTPSNNYKDKWIKEKEIAGERAIRYGDPSWIMGWG
jgi:hypothetical protein